MLDKSINILTVNTKKLKKEFVNFPWKIYKKKDYPNWVPPLKISVYETLDTIKNPFYKNAEIELFLAKVEGEIVGRIAAIENRAHNQFANDKVGFYGFFESINDQSVADALFVAVKQWLKQRGLTSIRGPVNPSTNHETGLLVRGQSQHPTVMTTWNPLYYVDLHEKANMQKAKDLVAYLIPVERIKNLPPQLIEYTNRLRKSSKVSFRDFDMKNYEREIEICFDIYNSAWEDNWGFFPMTREEFFHMARDMKMVLDPRWAFIAEFDGKPAGFMLALPDINYILKRIPNGKLLPTGILKLLFGRRFLKTVRVITLGVKKEFRRAGIFSLFTVESFTRAKKYNIIAGEASWILEDNVGMNTPWQKLGCPLYRRWRLFEQTID